MVLETLFFLVNFIMHTLWHIYRENQDPQQETNLIYHHCPKAKTYLSWVTAFAQISLQPHKQWTSQQTGQCDTGASSFSFTCLAKHEQMVVVTYWRYMPQDWLDTFLTKLRHVRSTVCVCMFACGQEQRCAGQLSFNVPQLAYAISTDA